MMRKIEIKQGYGSAPAEGLMQLLEARLPEIVRRERGNKGQMCLYEAGGYWTAFERSAYELCQLYPTAEPRVVTTPDGRTSVVWASVPESWLTAYGRNHLVLLDRADYKELIVTQEHPDHYIEWHRRSVARFREALAELRHGVSCQEKNNADMAVRRMMTGASDATSWVRLGELLSAQHQGVLARERDNDKLIYIYDTVESWVSFERSAYQLSKIFPDIRPAVVRLESDPFPKVMIAVPDETIRGYLRNHIARPFQRNHKILLGTPISEEHYAQWHRSVETD